MFLGRVVGRVVYTVKDASLTGQRLLIVQPLKPDLTNTGKQLVMLDAVGAGAGELIAEGVLAIEMCALAADVGMTIHPHPTLSETMMESAEIFYGQATDIYRPKR